MLNEALYINSQDLVLFRLCDALRVGRNPGFRIGIVSLAFVICTSIAGFFLVVHSCGGIGDLLCFQIFFIDLEEAEVLGGARRIKGAFIVGAEDALIYVQLSLFVDNIGLNVDN